MSMETLAVDSILVGTTCPGALLSTASAANSQFLDRFHEVTSLDACDPPSLIFSDRSASAKPPELQETDNNMDATSDEEAEIRRQESATAADSRMADETPWKPEDSTDSPPRPRPAEQRDIVQRWLAQYTLDMGCGCPGRPRKLEPGAGYKLAQLIGNIPSLSTSRGLPISGSEAELAVQTLSGSSRNAKASRPSEGTGPIIKALGGQQGGKKSVPQALINAHRSVKSQAASSGSEQSPQSGALPMLVKGSWGPCSGLVGIGSGESASGGKERTGRVASTNRGLPEFIGCGAGQQTNSITANLLFQQANPAQIQLSTGAKKDVSHSKNISGEDFERLLSDSSAHTSIKQILTGASARLGGTSGNRFADSALTDVGRQILESIHSSLRSGDQQITIRLNPPELGSVLIRFQEQQDQITGMLEVSKTQTGYQIEQALPQIIKDLQDAGVQIKRLEVTLSDRSEQQVSGDQLQQDDSSDYPGFGQNRACGEDSGHSWLTLDYTYQTVPEPQYAVTDHSINLLI